MATMVIKGKKMKSVDVDWKEFYYTNCPLISASNVDQELGWVSHGYIENDFDVFKWAAPEFLEKAAKELLEEEWKTRSTAKLPKAAAPLFGRIG